MISTLQKKVGELVERIESIYGQNPKPCHAYIQTGIHGIDNNIGGIPRAGITLIASDRPHVNSSFAMGIALNAAINQNISTVIVDTQRNGIGVTMRLLSLLSEIPIRTLTHARLDDNDWGSLSKALKILENVPIFIADDKPEPALNLIQAISDVCMDRGIGLVVFDGLNIDGQELSDASQFLQNSHWSRFMQLYQLSLRCDVPVIVTSKLRYSLTKIELDIPTLSDVPLDLLELIDMVIALYSSRGSLAENMQQPENGGIAVLKSHKNAFCVQADFHSETGSFVTQI